MLRRLPAAVCCGREFDPVCHRKSGRLCKVEQTVTRRLPYRRAYLAGGFVLRADCTTIFRRPTVLGCPGKHTLPLRHAYASEYGWRVYASSGKKPDQGMLIGLFVWFFRFAPQRGVARNVGLRYLLATPIAAHRCEAPKLTHCYLLRGRQLPMSQLYSL